MDTYYKGSGKHWDCWGRTRQSPLLSIGDALDDFCSSSKERAIKTTRLQVLTPSWRLETWQRPLCNLSRWVATTFSSLPKALGHGHLPPHLGAPRIRRRWRSGGPGVSVAERKRERLSACACAAGFRWVCQGLRFCGCRWVKFTVVGGISHGGKRR